MTPMKRFWFAAAVLLSTSGGAVAADFAVTADPSSRVWINGDSTLHPWSATTTAAALTAKFETSGPNTVLDGAVLSSLTLEIPVATLKSGKKGLDERMFRALKEPEHPAIRFVVTGRATVQKKGAAYAVSAAGTLSIAGRDRPAVIEAELATDSAGIRATGAEPMKMTEFGVKPPSVMGMVRTQDAIVVGFDLLLTPAGKP